MLDATSPHDAFATTQADCYCTVLGAERCGESLFLAYLAGHREVVAALRTVLKGNATGMSVTVCRALGPDKCRETVTEARAARGRAQGSVAHPAGVAGSLLSRRSPRTHCMAKQQIVLGR